MPKIDRAPSSFEAESQLLSIEGMMKIMNRKTQFGEEALSGLEKRLLQGDVDVSELFVNDDLLKQVKEMEKEQATYSSIEPEQSLVEIGVDVPGAAAAGSDIFAFDDEVMSREELFNRFSLQLKDFSESSVDELLQSDKFNFLLSEPETLKLLHEDIEKRKSLGLEDFRELP